MKNGICLLDWDGTLRPYYILFDWVKYLEERKIIKEGVLKELNSCLDCYKQAKNSNKPEKEIYNQLVEETARTYGYSIQGLKEEILVKHSFKFIEGDQKRLYPFAKMMLDHLHLKNIEVVIISGAPISLLERYSDILGFDKIYGLEYEINSIGEYTGKIIQNYGLYEKKEEVANLIFSESNQILFAIGNAYSDKPLFKYAKYGYLIKNTSDISNKEIGSISEQNVKRISPQHIFYEVKSKLDEGKPYVK